MNEHVVDSNGMLAVVAGVADALTSQQKVEHVLPDILASLLEAAGLTRGALLLGAGLDEADAGATGAGVAVAASAGFSEETLRQLVRFCNQPETVARCADRIAPLVVRHGASAPPESQDLLGSAGAQSMLVVPLTGKRDYLGVLCLASSDGEPAEHEWLPFARTVATQIGQALALSQAFSRVIAAESRYSVVMRGAHDGIVVLDGDGHILEVNPQLEKLLARSGPELVGTSIWKLITADDLKASQADFGRLIESGTIRSEGLRVSRPDGTIVVIDISASVSTLNEQRVVLAIVRDVTERTRARAQVELLQSLSLAASEAPDLPSAFDVVLGTLCQAANWTFGAAWLPRTTPAVLQCSRVFAREPLRFKRLTDVAFSESEGVLGRVWLSKKPFWVRDLATEPDCPRSAAAAALKIHSGLTVPVLVDLELIAILEFFSSDEREQDDQYVKLVAAAATQLGSIIARKRAEHSLLERVKLATLSAAIATAAATHDEIFDRCAAAVVKNLGALSTGIWLHGEGGPTLELRGMAGSDESGEGLRAQLLACNGWVERAFSLQKPHLDHGVVAFAGYPLVVAGASIGVLAICTEHALGDDLLEGLGVVASEIAAAIRQMQLESAKLSLEAQLRQAQKMEAIGTLAGGVAHDFNNVLSVILGYGEGLMGELGPLDPMREDIDEICRAGRRAADLTRQLLMFSRQQVVAPKVIDLNELLANTTKMLRRLLGADVELVLLPGVSLGRIKADWGSIEQVVMNLAVNARDAMPRGGKLTMEIANITLDEEYSRGHLHSRSGPHVMLAMTDTGTGMDKATQGRIFEPFFTTKGQGKGTGLGLSTVFGIVRQAEGSVWVYSEPGVGTTFKLYFPRVDAAIEQARASLPASAIPRGCETILLVEDDAQVRGVARSILAKHGYEVIVAQNAGEALLITGQSGRAIDLLLSDVVMPLMSGPELIKRIRAQRPNLKVLCMSGYTDDSIVRHGILDAQLPYLQKPITPETLTRKVREVLDMPLLPILY